MLLTQYLLFPEDAECELNCKPIGMRYFATLNKTVIDGTPCSKPTEYFRRNNSGRGICVEGLCKVCVARLILKFFALHCILSYNLKTNRECKNVSKLNASMCGLHTIVSHFRWRMVCPYQMFGFFLQICGTM